MAKKLIAFLFFWSALLAVVLTEQEGAGPVVSCSAGSIRGRYGNINGLKWEEFFGIPFAKPPVGDLRFRAPEPHEGWAGVRNGTSHRERCYAGVLATELGFRPYIQGQSEKCSEDCLFLNIFVPDSVSRSKKSPKAVMVWIYGGGFLIGDTVSYDAMVLSSMNDVIVVTVAYRIGPLGFFTTGDGEAPGNYGLMDQQMALRWVHENIEAFGGDPKRVTIFGESAGSASVSFQVLNPISRQYFQRAISHSGSSADGWLKSEFTPYVSTNLTNAFNCSGDSKSLMKCMREVDAELIFSNTGYNMQEPGFAFRWLPVVDGEMVRDEPKKLMESGEGASIEYMMGTTDSELLMISEMGIKSITEPEAETVSEEAFRNFYVAASVGSGLLPNISEVLDAVEKAYFKDMQYEKEECIRAATSFITDGFMCAGTARNTREHYRNGGKVYLYEFSHRPPVSLMSIFSNVTVETEGTQHADDIMYYFGWPHHPALPNRTELFNFTEKDKEMADIFMKLISNFAKTGNPNTKDTQWPVWTAEKEEYLDINLQPQVRSQYMRGKASLWLDEIPTLIKEAEERANPVVACPSGSVRGRHRDANGLEWEEFFGIPFAKPPVGDLRFRAPELLEGWEGIRDGTAHRERCFSTPMVPQLGVRKEVEGTAQNCSEDCLFLNINVPHSVEEAKKNPKAVMVWIYGGGFLIGDTVTYDGMVLSSMNDVIVVTVAYRIGPLGFFTTGDSEAPGNYGLLDQQMALRWVHENIEAFGGDPKRVTIFGESAGASSVSFQVLNPTSRQYFQRAISFSGSAFDRWFFSSETPIVSKNLTEALGCSGESESLMECMRKTDVQLIFNNTGYVFSDPSFRFNWAPVVDNNMVKDDPKKLLESGESHGIEYMMGTTSDEHLFVAETIVKGMLEDDNKTVNAEAFHSVFMGAAIMTGILPNTSVAIKAVENKYISSLTYEKKQCTLALSKLLTDIIFKVSTSLNAREHAGNQGKTYLFEFAYPQSVSLLGILMGFEAEFEGTNHGDDISYTFGYPHHPDIPVDLVTFTEEDKTMADIFMRLISNFAKTGNPSTAELEWPVWEAGEEKYLEIKLRPEVRSGFMGGRAPFWLDDIPSLPLDARDEL